jgi:hypothetical protein
MTFLVVFVFVVFVFVFVFVFVLLQNGRLCWLALARSRGGGPQGNPSHQQGQQEQHRQNQPLQSVHKVSFPYPLHRNGGAGNHLLQRVEEAPLSSLYIRYSSFACIARIGPA